MNKEMANYIDKLLYDSDLFPDKTKQYSNSSSYDFTNETIIITGAAGSIGSGLSKQLIHCKFKKLILIDNAESPLYELIKSLEFKDTSKVEFILIDITNRNSITQVYKKYKPTLIFHTAAYKHVPLMESNPIKAIELNIFGTKLLADLSCEFKVKKFLFISTDKAVNPISIMGLTKRIAENYLNLLNSKTNTVFVSTRFGNILGSNGSIVPLLKKQIELGLPITLTDINVTRYFICKQKACNLILKLATLEKFDYNLYTFNMGNPVKISDLIERMYLICNSEAKTHELKIIGLRPGEKLHEEIISIDEELFKTVNPEILGVKQKKTIQPKNINFSELQNMTNEMTSKEVKKNLKKFI